MDDPFITRLLRNSNKAELLESLAHELETVDKAVVIVLERKGEGDKFALGITLLGFSSVAEVVGVLEIAKWDFLRGS